MSKALEYLKEQKRHIPKGNTYDSRLDEAITELEELMKPKSCELCAYSCEYKTNNYECNLLEYTDQDGTLSYINVERNFYCKLFRLKV